MPKNKVPKRTIQFLVSLILLFAAVMSLILVFMQTNKTRIINQNQQYLEDLAAKSVANIDEFFSYAADSVTVVSKLYELQLDTPEFDYTLLNDMSQPTPFDYMRFVSLDGQSWSGDGSTVNCVDREYYIEGRQGHSGVCFLDNSRFTRSPIIIFYSPFYYDGQLIGIVNGVLNTDSLTKHLETSFFGHNAAAFLCQPDGTAIVSTWRDTSWDNHDAPFSFLGSSLSDEDISGIIQSMRSGEPVSLALSVQNGFGNAYIAPIANGEFILVQTIPSSATANIIDRASSDAMKFEIGLIIIFLIYIICFALYYILRNKKILRENDDLNEIVNSIKRIYSSFVIIDLNDDSYEYLKKGDYSPSELSETGRYSDWVSTIKALHQQSPEYWGSMGGMTPEHISTLLTKDNWFTHMEYRTPDKHWKRLTLIKLDMESDSTMRVLGAVDDITDTKLREESSRQALEAAFHAAEAANRAKSEFLSNMSHDIRTPMNAIVGLTTIMSSHLDERDRLESYLAKISSSSKHLLGLINDILDMSKIESGKFTLTTGDFNLSSFIDDLLTIIQPTVKAKQQTLIVHLGDIMHENVIGDSLRLQQVCVNILSNAVKYTPAGGNISVSISEQPGNQPMLSEFEFIFEDNGIGMTPEFLERIFSPFERANDSRINGIQGTGLGMSITHNIVTLMGGTITAESELGKGSRFTVCVPLKLQEPSSQSDTQLLGKSVLVADDDPVACESACVMLSELGIESVGVLSGMEAVKIATERHTAGNDFFAVLLDWKMPDMDGLQTSKALHTAVGPDVPIVINSSFDWSDIENAARAVGVSAFIGKPLFKSKLQSLLTNIMSKSVSTHVDPLAVVRAKSYTGKRILLVEDNELNQEIAKEILETTGLSVEIANNGKIGVEMFNSAPVDYYSLIFMDIQMPIMNGIDAARALRALPRADAAYIPIVAMSANTFAEDVSTSLEAGMNQHIGKPLDLNQLMDSLAKWLT